MYAWDITECTSCEQLIFTGEEVAQTEDGLVCSACAEDLELVA